MQILLFSFLLVQCVASYQPMSLFTFRKQFGTLRCNGGNIPAESEVGQQICIKKSQITDNLQSEISHIFTHKFVQH